MTTPSKTQKTTSKKIPWKYIIIFWSAILLTLPATYLFFYGVANWQWLGPLPSFAELENPKSVKATEIFSEDGKILGTYYKGANRSEVTFDRLSPHLVNGLVATEDERFYDHAGIDGWAILRAIAGVATGGKGGGSTISQQLAKMLFTVKPNAPIVERIKQKLKEWVIAVQLEQRYTKEEIIAMYFNMLDFINGGTGIKSASRVYFSSKPDDLTVEQAAMFVGMAKSPVRYNPFRHNKRSKNRRNVVLKQMVKNGYLEQAAYDSLKVLPLGLKRQSVNHVAGPAPYFRAELQKWLNRWCKENGYNMYKDGLKVYTTINSSMQDYAESAVKKHIKDYLQPTFFEHWKDISNAPFYFGDEEDFENKDTIKLLVRDKLVRGMKQSERYNAQLSKQKHILKKEAEYRKYKSPQNRLKGTLTVLYETHEYLKNELDLLNQDSSGNAFTYRQKVKVMKRLKPVKDSIKWANEEIEKLQPDVDRTLDAFREIIEPFNDSMYHVFQKPVKTTLFSWDGDIDTTISPWDSTHYANYFLKAGMLSLEPQTGHIKAWVGGINFKHFKYDHVNQGARQVGSTFKPFVYATAIENGLSPCYEVLNKRVTLPVGTWGIKEEWSPKNTSPSFLKNEWVSLKIALANSLNTVSAYTMKRFGPQAAIDVAKRCGITSYIESVPSIALGTTDIKLYEMVGAYGTFVNSGVWIEPTFISRIEDNKGNVIYRPTPKVRQAMSQENAYKMVELLSGVAEWGPKINGRLTYGTGIRLRTKRYEYGGISDTIAIAGKTGTTQNNSDGWFMGLTPDLVTGVWVGASDRAVHFRTTKLGMGTNMALPIWAYYMKDVWKDEKISIRMGEFDKPKSLENEDFDCSKQKNKSPSQNPMEFDKDPFSL